MISDRFGNDRTPIEEIRIYSDSSSALENIMDPGHHPGQLYSLVFLKNIEATLLTSPDLQIHLCWTPGHEDVRGNEKADKEARIASKRPSASLPTQAYLKAKIKRTVVGKWSSLVEKRKLTPGVAVTRFYPPKTTPTTIFKDTPREVFGRVTQTLSGHGYTGEYYARMRIPESLWCLCSTSDGAPVFNSRHHVLKECRRYSRDRRILIDDIPNLLDPDWQVASLGEPKKALPAFVRFLENSGAFTKLGIPFKLNLILPPPRPKKPP